MWQQLRAYFQNLFVPRTSGDQLLSQGSNLSGELLVSREQVEQRKITFPLYFVVPRPRQEIDDIIRKNVQIPGNTFEVYRSDFSRNIILERGGGVYYTIRPVTEGRYLEWLQFTVLLEALEDQTHILVRTETTDAKHTPMIMLLIYSVLENVFPKYSKKINVTDEITEEIDIQTIASQIKQKRRRLNIRKEQAAKYGYNVDPSILMEIEDLEHDVKALEQQLPNRKL